jgi:hypothetical protein
MDLTPEQKAQVSQWIADDANLAEVQRRLESEFGLRMTYMDVRFLIDDLAIDLPDKKPAPTPIVDGDAAEGEGDDDVLEADDLDDDFGGPAGGGKVSVTIDKITRPGALASGTVKFSDGVKANWLLDQMGRMGLDGVDRNYRPSDEDMMDFQRELSAAARKMGL